MLNVGLYCLPLIIVAWNDCMTIHFISVYTGEHCTDTADPDKWVGGRYGWQWFKAIVHVHPMAWVTL